MVHVGIGTELAPTNLTDFSKYANKIHGLLSDHGITEEVKPLTKEGREFLREHSLPMPWDALLDSYIGMIETLTEEIQQLEETIEERAGSLKETQLLMTIPGVSYYTALTIYAELGEIDRFDGDKEVAHLKADWYTHPKTPPKEAQKAGVTAQTLPIPSEFFGAGKVATTPNVSDLLGISNNILEQLFKRIAAQAIPPSSRRDSRTSTRSKTPRSPSPAEILPAIIATTPRIPISSRQSLRTAQE